MEKLLLSLLVLAFANPDPAPPSKTNKMPPSASKKKPKLSPETKAAIELSKIKPLPHIEAMTKVKKTIGPIKQVDDSGAYRLTPREPWHAGAYLNFISSNVFVGSTNPEVEPYAVVFGTTSWSSWVEISVPVRAGWAYAIDCQVTGATNFLLNRGGAGEEPISSDGPHLSLGVPRQSADGTKRFLVSSATAFRISGCEVIPGR